VKPTRILRAAVLILWALLAWPAPAARAQTATPVVHAIMFWKAGFHYCEQTISVILPPIQEEYGDRFDLRLVSIVTQEDAENLFRLAEAFGMDWRVVGVPFLIVGDQVLMGPPQIHEKLPGLIDEYLAQGGVDLPDNPILAEFLPAPTPAWTSDLPAAAQAVPSPEADPGFSGRDLATGTLFLLCAILVYSPAAFVWERLPAPSGRRTEAAMLVLIALGLVVAGYLSYEQLRSGHVACGLVGDCNAVQDSSYARLFGVLPVGVLGLAGYLLLALAWALARLAPRLRGPARLATLGLAFFGTVFSTYLTYLERFVIRAVCPWCISSAVLMGLILLCSIGPAREP
jgi:uncharacterized membrane protein